MLTQTWAIMVDAYRELNSKKLFWISLAVSLVVIVTIAIPSQTDTGMRMLGLEINFPILSSKVISKHAFYTLLVSSLGVNFWLGWGAIVLAFISTAGMFPDLISSGAIELSLSRPISRLRLFFSKFLAGILFVALQASVFAIGTVLVIGVRGEHWTLKPLLVVPILVALYSYLHCISVLVGVLTRSTLLALLATAILLIGLSVFGTAENLLLEQRRTNEREVAVIKQRKEALDRSLAELRAHFASGDTAATDAASREKENRLQDRLRDLTLSEQKQSDLTLTISRWHNGLYAAQTLLPKTGETKGLFTRYAVDKSDMDSILNLFDGSSDDPERSSPTREIGNRSVFWIVGTSLIFEGVILSVAAWLFCRRDF